MIDHQKLINSNFVYTVLSDDEYYIVKKVNQTEALNEYLRGELND